MCPNAANNAKWNGQWTNINASAGSVCGCIAQ
ncbi:MAG TPA: mannan-binding protein [Candidatus Kapabacteria bacterium]|nr:mannan-binding protein [Candidatus Kapabacteria bacterium]